MSESDAITSSDSDASDGNSLNVLVEGGEHVQTGESFASGLDGAYKRHISRAAATGNWVKASSFDRTHPNWECAPLTEEGDTALHIAVSMGQTSFVEKLVERMQDMEILNAYGNTALCMAAISGNVKISTILLRKNPRLAWIRGHKGMLPLQLALSAAKPHMVKFLFRITQEHKHSDDLPFQDIVKLFFLALTYSFYTVALILLDMDLKLASTKNEEGLIALEVLARLSFDKDALGYRDVLHLLFKHMEEEEFLDLERTSKAMFDAAKSGNIMILDFILKYNPTLLMRMNSEGQSLLHIAILYRQTSVYQLILSKGAYKDAIIHEVDHEGNNVLHLAAKLPAELGRAASPINHSLIHNEEQWFEVVERIVPHAFKAMRNGEGWTPEDLFVREHRELSEKAATDINEMANTFLLVATLIVTLGITGALTIRTNNIQGPTVLFGQKTWFIIFLLSAAVGIAMCAISMLFFVSTIICSVLKQKGVSYVRSRQIRVITGCWLLVLSIGVLIIFSIMSGTVLVYSFSPKWVLYTIAALSGIGAILVYLIFRSNVSYSLGILLSHCKKAIAALKKQMQH